MTSLALRPITLREANAFVGKHHRHNKPVRGCKFCLSAWVGDELVGVAIVGRPVARMIDDGMTAEVLRVCVVDGARNACSFLYGAARRTWKAMGGSRLVTYTLASESWASLRAAGFKIAASVKGEQWSRHARPRAHQDVCAIDKHRWHAS